MAEKRKINIKKEDNEGKEKKGKILPFTAHFTERKWLVGSPNENGQYVNL